MKNRAILPGLFLSAALALWTSPIAAHHQMVAQFSVNKPITLRGTVTKVEWVNPHGWIFLNVKDGNGRVEAWEVETGSPYSMTKRGLKPSDLLYGTEVIIGAYAARDGSKKAAGMVVTFPAKETAGDTQDATFALGR